ncbi:MAG: dUTP diphosphatase [Acidaminococcus sp.]|jgi:dUTP pyrophosphatase|nr:dUTP diphosphatase [Acidaminococcus sp.]MCI2099419.1 dUTP diphosphatase [Acidaminococcus sp.]MCI2113779.1 dUTP diphosphatase [Acidaminococcus sp.]MCI2115647.1 dUTP diphosphatase [Acidaminococcus sp.]
MTKVRGFEKISAYKDKEFPMPRRQTKASAGYDIYLPDDAVIPAHGQTMVPTGVKAYMQGNEYLGIHIRSSMAIKRHLRLLNNEGIVDADYYNNPDNEGHIMLALANDTDEDIVLKKGERAAQGIFYSYLLADDDDKAPKADRSGGFGSTSK